MARKPAARTAQDRFALLLAKHLAGGTHPRTTAGEPWTDAAFAEQVTSPRANDYVSPRTVSNWRKGKSLPTEIEPILQALFGPNGQLTDVREALRRAFQTARQERYASVITRTKRDPAGAKWVVKDGQLALDRSVCALDEDAAADPLRQQLQSATRNAASDLTISARRLENSCTWGSLWSTAEAFSKVLEGNPLEMPRRLGIAYSLLLRLGRFLETDARVQRDSAAPDGPLDPDIHGLLTDLVRVAAPWLRGFPTVAAWDDEAGKALVRADLFQPAREFTRIAREQQAISEQDAGEMELLAEAAGASGYQGQKAGNRTVGTAKNLMLTAAQALATSLSGATTSGFTSQSPLVQRAWATLATAEAQVEAFAATLPDDLRHALRVLVAEGRELHTSPTLAEAASAGLPDKDYITGEYFVFRDELGLSQQDKHMVEASALDFLPDSITFFGTSVGKVSTLAAEKMRRPDGSPFVLVRKAMPREWVEHMRDDSSRPCYKEPQNLDVMSEIDAGEALDFLVEIEPDPSDCETIEEYKNLLKFYESSLTAAKRTLRRFAEGIEPRTLGNMQKVYYAVLDRYAGNSFAAGVAGSYLSEAMNGIGEWRS